MRLKRDLAGRSVGAVGLGCMSFGGIYGGTDEDESFACLAEALALGVDHWDVAEIYGEGVSETVMGKFLAQHRSDVSIATKAGIYQKPTRHFRNDEEALRRSLEGSLSRLGRDRVELFYIHRREAERPIEQVMETLVGFIEEGLIGSIGLSEVAPATLRRASAVHPVAAVQSEYSLWSRQPELGLIDACAELGTTFVAFSPLGRGVFADSFPDNTAFPPGDFRSVNPRFIEPNYSANKAAIASVSGVVPRAGLDGSGGRRGLDPASGRPRLADPRDAQCGAPPGAGAGRRDCPDPRGLGRDRGDPARRVRPWRALCRCAMGRGGAVRLDLTLSVSRMPRPPARSAGVVRSRPRSLPRRGRRRSTRCWFRNRPPGHVADL
jgi:aryl-alcohol dehydrogenase-like predicted oxidoreductase